jgi:hypothetical protein
MCYRCVSFSSCDCHVFLCSSKSSPRASSTIPSIHRNKIKKTALKFNCQMKSPSGVPGCHRERVAEGYLEVLKPEKFDWLC